MTQLVTDNNFELISNGFNNIILSELRIVNRDEDLELSVIFQEARHHGLDIRFHRYKKMIQEAMYGGVPANMFEPVPHETVNAYAIYTLDGVSYERIITFLDTISGPRFRDVISVKGYIPTDHQQKNVSSKAEEIVKLFE